MLFKQFEAKGLAHYSYAVGDKEVGEVIIIDPERDVKTYIDFAAEHRLKIKYVIETHIHADYASGAKELALRSGAELCLSSYDENEKYAYGYDHTPLKEGDKLDAGRVHIQVLHTPGHTPEHISFLQSDDEGKPVALFSGDFLFIGSVGRPDLLGDADKTPLAKQMYHSVTEKLKGLPDELEVYPAHGAGSLCGAGLGKGSHTTLGEERGHNPYLQTLTEDEFVSKLLSNMPPFPEYYKRMKDFNSAGPTILQGRPKPAPVDVEEFAKLAESGAFIIDMRHPLAFGGGHIDGSINVGALDQLGFWAAWLTPYDKDVYLVIDDESAVRDYWQAYVRVGLDNVKGYLKPSFSAWANKGNDFIDLPQASVYMLNDFIEMGEKLTVVDVRAKNEWDGGHIKQAKHVYLGDISTNINKLGSKEDPIFFVCGGGTRSSIAASILMKNGFENVYNVFGGMTAWTNAELPTTDK